MPRKITFEVDIADDGEMNIKTVTEGSFSLIEKFGIARLIDNAIIDSHNQEADKLQKQPTHG